MKHTPREQHVSNRSAHPQLYLLVAWILVTSTAWAAEPPAEDRVVPDDAGTVEVVVHVLEAGTRVPLTAARVSFASDSESDGGWTNVDGVVRLQLSAGLWSVSCELDGYLLERQPLILVAQTSPVELRYFLAPNAAESGSPLVYTTTGKRGDAVRRLDATEVSSVPASRNDPVGALSSLPGVARAAYGTGLLVVRGGSALDHAAVVDGVPIARAVHPFGARTVVPICMLDSVVLSPGVFSAKYGNALGGLLELNTRTPDPMGHHGQAGLDFLEAAACAEGGLEGGATYQVGIRRTYLEPFGSVIADATDTEVATLPTFSDYQGRLTWDPLPSHHFEAFMLGVDDAIELHSDDADLETREATTRATLRHRYRRGHFEHEAIYALTSYDQTVVDTYNRFESEGLAHMLRETVTYQADDRLRLTAGVEGTLEDYDLFTLGYIKLYVFHFDLDRIRTDLTSFVEATLTWPGEGEFKLGGRVQQTSSADVTVGDLRASARFGLGDDLELHAAAGSFSQPVSPLDLELLPEPIAWQRSSQVEVGLRFQLDDSTQTQLDLAVFRRDLWNLGMAEIHDPVFLPTIGTYELHQRGEGQVVGLELLLRVARWAGLQAWLAYSFTNEQVRDRSDQSWQRAPTSQPHNLDIVASYALSPGWRLGLRFELSTGAPISTGTRQQFGSALGHRSDPLLDVEPSYKLNLRVDKTWLFDLWSLAAYLDVENVTWHRNVEAAYTDFLGEPVIQQGLPILPSLGLRVEY